MAKSKLQANIKSIKTSRKTAGNILRPEIRPTSEIPFHHDPAPGKRWLFIDQTIFNNSNIYIAVRTLHNIKKSQPSYIDTHVHNVDSVFCFLGNGKDLTGLEAEVRLGNKKYIVSSPVSVYIPKGTKHSYRPIKGSGKFVSIVLSGDYKDSIAINND